MYFAKNPESYWPNRLKKAALSKILYVYTSQRQRVSNPKKYCFSEYYSKLYNLHTTNSKPTSDPAQIDQFFKSIHLPALTSDHVHSPNQPISKTEILKNIQTIPLHKAPGLMGSVVNILKHSSTLFPYLCQTFDHFLVSGAIPEESLEAPIITSPKHRYQIISKDLNLPYISLHRLTNSPRSGRVCLT